VVFGREASNKELIFIFLVHSHFSSVPQATFGVSNGSENIYGS